MVNEARTSQSLIHALIQGSIDGQRLLQVMMRLGELLIQPSNFVRKLLRFQVSRRPDLIMLTLQRGELTLQGLLLARRPFL